MPRTRSSGLGAWRDAGGGAEELDEAGLARALGGDEGEGDRSPAGAAVHAAVAETRRRLAEAMASVSGSGSL